MKKGYYRPLTFHEWCISTGCDMKPDNRSEYRKIREIIREGRRHKIRRASTGDSSPNADVVAPPPHRLPSKKDVPGG
jgi:hypothetical protein